MQKCIVDVDDLVLKCMMKSPCHITICYMLLPYTTSGIRRFDIF